MPKLSDPYAYPPRGLSREEASRYVGVGTTQFDEMVADNRMPKPKKINSRLVWDRIAIDTAFADLPSNDEIITDKILARQNRPPIAPSQAQLPKATIPATADSNTPREARFIKLREVMARTSLGRSTIYAKMEKGVFPRPRRLSEACVRWFESDVEKWMAGMVASEE